MEITQIINGIASRGFWFNLAYWSTALAVFYLGLIVYLRDKKSATNRAFFIFSVGHLCWAIITPIYMAKTNYQFSLFTNRLGMMLGFYISGAYLHFCHVFPKRKVRMPTWEKLLAFGSIGFAIVTIVSPLVLSGVEPYSWGMNGIQGPLYAVAALWFLAYVIIGVAFLIRKRIVFKGKQRAQIQYVILAMSLTAIWIFPISLIYPIITDESKYDMFGPIGFIFFFGFSYYAIVKHRLLDIKRVFLKSAVYSTLIGFITASYIFVIYYLKKYYEQAINLDIVFVLAILVATFGFQPLRIRLQKLADQWFSKSNYNFQELLKKISNILSTNLVIDDLSEQLLNTLISEMKIQKAAFALKDGFQKGNDFYFKKEEVRELFNIARFNQALVADELEDDDTRKNLMRKLGIEVLVYFADDGKAIGFLALSEKASGDAYSSQDLKLLEIIAPQITIALKNIEQQQQMIEQIVEERQRINQDAHDHIYNRLGALAKKAEVALESPNDVKPTLELLKDDLRRSVTDLQRIVSGEAEQDSTECLAKEELESIIKDFTNKSNVDLAFNCDSSVTKKLNPQHFWHFQCILEECLNNVHKHSKATEVDVSLTSNNGSIVMQVKDNGVGLRNVRSRKSGVGSEKLDERNSGLGLTGMKERAKKMNADLNFSSNGHGTTVELKVPILT